MICSLTLRQIIKYSLSLVYILYQPFLTVQMYFAFCSLQHFLLNFCHAQTTKVVFIFRSL